ncbi:uncharacterized protein MONOS_10847 [Monocercomonoides exilis]|uniref:uncharacterized protein n=1 Tax=Monocercomonoides exilis TaxID=2049356 RepID=UPI00355A8BF2|nr:hypothetical protein MONOS_10847 [Monocercomonoides exilis]|eukprot:MONOS_10847.1-p1 / transcript=MONOS_10847.1 / gene=MONOS_10847 / organism=Monocercomonoides_exilis_PA203 / gene_product=unspecified product / transcript_product=unspecified product / location=Mono_scaffold00510:45070-46342(-) / protein_length=311 / sequence_SO=supercontig / SO=protein_coding / is_pseudo=false
MFSVTTPGTESSDVALMASSFETSRVAFSGVVVSSSCKVGVTVSDQPSLVTGKGSFSVLTNVNKLVELYRKCLKEFEDATSNKIGEQSTQETLTAIPSSKTEIPTTLSSDISQTENANFISRGKKTIFSSPFCFATSCDAYSASFSIFTPFSQSLHSLSISNDGTWAAASASNQGFSSDFFLVHVDKRAHFRMKLGVAPSLQFSPSIVFSPNSTIVLVRLNDNKVCVFEKKLSLQTEADSSSQDRVDQATWPSAPTRVIKNLRETSEKIGLMADSDDRDIYIISDNCVLYTFCKSWRGELSDSPVTKVLQ